MTSPLNFIATHLISPFDLPALTAPVLAVPRWNSQLNTTYLPSLICAQLTQFSDPTRPDPIPAEQQTLPALYAPVQATDLIYPLTFRYEQPSNPCPTNLAILLPV